jgi:hypothetical protein
VGVKKQAIAVLTAFLNRKIDKTKSRRLDGGPQWSIKNKYGHASTGLEFCEAVVNTVLNR